MGAVGVGKHIRVVPHFMRLHEWIALEEGYYQVEGLEPELLPEVMHRVSTHRASPYLERPQDQPFREARGGREFSLRVGVGLQCRGWPGEVRTGPVRCRPVRHLRQTRRRSQTAHRPARHPSRSGDHGWQPLYHIAHIGSGPPP